MNLFKYFSKSNNSEMNKEENVVEQIKKREIQSVEVLGGDQWLQLKEMTYDDGAKYTFMHELRCNGQIVSILPYRVNSEGVTQYLFRNESTAIWDSKNLVLSSVTGGVDPDDTVEKTALKELKEETGYLGVETMLERLGTTYGVKSSDTVYHLFAINVSNCVKIPAKNHDPMENEAENKWFDASDLAALDIAGDPFVYVLFMKHAISQIKYQQTTEQV